MKTLLVATTLMLAAMSATPTSADVITSGQTLIRSEATQTITLLPGTDFNPLSENLVIPDVTGKGFLNLQRDAQTGTTIAIPSLTGVYTGSNAQLGGFQFGTLTPAGQSEFSGSITNVVQDTTDPGFATGDPSSFLSGDYQVSGNFFEFQLLATGAFFTTGPVTFNSVFDGLPPTAGTIIDGGADPVDIFFNGDVVGFSTGRQILVTAVPEPSAIFVMAGLGCVVATRRGRRRPQKA